MPTYPHANERAGGADPASDATAHHIPMPHQAYRQPGDLILTVITSDGNPTITAPAGWTKLGQVSNSTTVTTAAFWTRQVQPRNLANRPIPGEPAANGKLSWNEHWYGAGGVGTGSIVYGATDGVAGVDTYWRKTWTTGGAVGDTGFVFANGWNGPSTGGAPITAGDVITMSCWVRANASGKVFRWKIDWHDAAGAATRETAASTVTLTAGTWTRVSYTTTVPAGTTTWTPSFTGDSGTNWVAADTLDGTALMVTKGSTLYDFAPIFTTSAAEQVTSVSYLFKNGGVPTWTTATGSSTNPPPPAITKAGDSYVVCVAGVDGNTIPTSQTFSNAYWGFTRLFGLSSTGVSQFAMEFQSAASGAITPNTFTISPSQVWAAATIAVPYLVQFPTWKGRRAGAWQTATNVKKRVAGAWIAVGNGLWNWIWLNAAGTGTQSEPPAMGLTGYAHGGVQDNFTATSINATLWTAAGSPTFSGGNLNVAPTTTQQGVTGKTLGRITDRYAMLTAVSVPTTAGQTTAMRVQNAANTIDAQLYFRDGNLRTEYITPTEPAGSYFAMTSTGTEIWLSIRHLNGLLRWEFSRDAGYTWYTLRAENDRSLHYQTDLRAAILSFMTTGTGTSIAFSDYNGPPGWGYSEP